MSAARARRPGGKTPFPLLPQPFPIFGAEPGLVDASRLSCAPPSDPVLDAGVVVVLSRGECPRLDFDPCRTDESFAALIARELRASAARCRRARSTPSGGADRAAARLDRRVPCYAPFSRCDSARRICRPSAHARSGTTTRVPKRSGRRRAITTSPRTGRRCSSTSRARHPSPSSTSAAARGATSPPSRRSGTSRSDWTGPRASWRWRVRSAAVKCGSRTSSRCGCPPRASTACSPTPRCSTSPARSCRGCSPSCARP